MYVPSLFAEDRLPVLHEFIAQHDFAALITAGPQGLIASHVPMLLLPDRGPRGALQFHLAMPNDQRHDLAAGAPALAIFQGPHGYISPTWYESPLSVPTWNYIAVHASGAPRALMEDELAEHLHTLVERYERGPGAWSSRALPTNYFDKMRNAVAGFEMEIAKLEGKWKLGQNRTSADRRGAIEGLRRAGDAASKALADLMEAKLRT